MTTKTTAKKPTATTAKIDTKPIDDAVAAGKQTVEQAVAATKEQVEKASSAALKSYEEATSMNKDNMDAFVQAANIWTKGLENMSKAYMAAAQTSVEASVNAGKALLAAKTVNEVVELQSDLVRNNFDTLVAEGTKLSELSFKVANETIEPLQTRFASTVEKLNKSAFSA